VKRKTFGGRKSQVVRGKRETKKSFPATRQPGSSLDRTVHKLENSDGRSGTRDGEKHEVL
jgi:hypothetical protein